MHGVHRRLPRRRISVYPKPQTLNVYVHQRLPQTPNPKPQTLNPKLKTPNLVYGLRFTVYGCANTKP
jgi:hypothetical protein